MNAPRSRALAHAALLSLALGALAACSQQQEPSTAAEAPMTNAPEAPTAGQSGEQTVMVGGAAMYPSKNIVENAVNSQDHTTLVAAVKAAGLVDTLASAGPFTVFAPTNEAFSKLPEGTVDSLLQPENKGKLTTVLTYHVVAGRMTARDLASAVEAGGGTATLKTVAGGELKVTPKGSTLEITDAAGGKSTVTIADVLQSNGVIHVVDAVLLPG